MLTRPEFWRRRWWRLLILGLGLGAVPFSIRGEPTPAASAPEAPVLAPFRDPEGDRVLAFLERRVADDPLDYLALNRLGGEYLRRLRVTGDLTWLPRAAGIARRSLEGLPADHNLTAVILRSRVEQEDHRFRDAAVTARRLEALAPHQLSTWETLGDALLEEGEMPGAANAFRRMAELAEGDGRPPVEGRLARLALARGDRPAARAGFARTVEFARAANVPEPESEAFGHLQLGRMDFEEGRWPEAESHYRAALLAVPASAGAFVNLAEMAAARGENALAQRLYGELIRQVPRPDFCHELADFLIFTGRPEVAKPWADRALAGYQESVERGERMYFHHLAAFFSDTREAPAEALFWANRDLEQRHTPAALDVLAWALYRGGRFAEAAAEMDRALAAAGPAANSHLLGHAGLIFLRANDAVRAVSCQRRAQSLNPNLNAFHAHR